MFASQVVFGLAASCFIGAVISLILSLRRPVAEPPMTFDSLDRDLGAVVPGDYTPTFAIANPANRPRRVIGFAEG